MYLDTWCCRWPPCAYSGLLVDSFFYVNFYHIWSKTNICPETPRNYHHVTYNADHTIANAQIDMHASVWLLYFIRGMTKRRDTNNIIKPSGTHLQQSCESCEVVASACNNNNFNNIKKTPSKFRIWIISLSIQRKKSIKSQQNLFSIANPPSNFRF